MIHDGRDIKLEPGVLIDATTGSHLWAQRYDGLLSNVFELQDDVVGNIISALSINKGMDESPGLRRQETGSAQACNYFLHARNRFSCMPARGTGIEPILRACASMAGSR
jgi:hypothetical protein